MNSVPRCACAALILVAAGCIGYDRAQEPTGTREMWVSETIQRASIERAIVVQSTLFPYHFVQNSADLNELGLRDLGVLAAHFVDHPGELSVRGGDTADELYRARVQRVAETLADLGVSAEGIHIVDNAPGGDGVTSARMIQIFESKGPQGEAIAPTESGTSASSTGGQNQ